MLPPVASPDQHDAGSSRRDLCNRIGVVPCIVLLVHVVVASARAGSYTEDFTTTTYMDPAATTAEWDTAGGEIRLPAFAPTVLATVPVFQPQAIATDGDLAYLMDNNGNLVIVDIVVPESPVV